MTIDNIDKEIISILLKDGRKSLSEIGNKLGMSHVAVSKRLDKMINENILRVTAGVNAEKLDIKILFMGIETESSEVADRILKKYRDCPRLLVLSPVTGRYNLFAVMVVEDTWSLESVVGTCSMRTEPGVRKSESWFGNAPLVPEFLPVDLAPAHKKDDTTPCGRKCYECSRYEMGKCVGCPPTKEYNGLLWASPKTQPKRQRKSKS
ncbi:MAG: Lrp/AsnC family transcriptional regulator [Candidatus Thorarchaeota archaeon]|nr:Lrp/AsnC family transcriptional regulator [Candidatus Thorarchaeota archaeon]